LRQLHFLIIFFVFQISCLQAQTGWIPKWSFIADSGSSICSPIVVNDIAIVGSGWENAATNFSVFALDIDNGSLIWNKKFPNQIIGLSTPHKGNIIVTGRKAIFSCLDYETGNEIWKFDRNSFGHVEDSFRFNFNQPQWVKDLNGDGEKDLIAIYGGGSTAKKPFRPAGYLLAIDGTNGQIIASDTMPDGHETYSTPLIYNNNIYFGSGGETVGGSFYKTSFSDLLNGNIQQSKIIATNNNKGFISAPTIFGATMIIPCLDETIYAYNLIDDSLEFEFSIVGNEIYSSIHVIDSIFYFTSQKGSWPFYQGYSTNQFDNKGNIIDSITKPIYHFSSPISLNSPEAMLIVENKDLGFAQVNYNHKFKVTQRGNFDSVIIESPWIFGIHLYATPRSTFLMEDDLGYVSIDCDNKGFLTVSGFDQTNYYSNKKIVVSLYELPENLDIDNSKNSFGGYLGNMGNGYYQANPCNLTEVEEKNVIQMSIFPNPTNDLVYVLSNIKQEKLQLFNLQGKLMIESKSSIIDLRNLKTGLYIIKATYPNQIVKTKKILVKP
jgi:outer membrane protein assembly factor BamB